MSRLRFLFIDGLRGLRFLFDMADNQAKKDAQKLMQRAPQATQKLFKQGKAMDRDKKRAEWYAKNKGAQ